jgi:RNA polymerase sigma factor (sigma-70 family)
MQTPFESLVIPQPEAEALAALDRHDRDSAFGTLMREYGRPLYRYCCQVLRDPTLADDALQTTFLQAYRDIERFGRRSTLRAWLFGIATHRCLDALKKRQRERLRLVPEESAPELPAEAVQVEAEVARSSLSEALARCVEQLEARVRSALLLRYLQELSYPEMAAVLNEAPATLQARVSRALPVLRRCLETHGVTP